MAERDNYWSIIDEEGKPLADSLSSRPFELPDSTFWMSPTPGNVMLLNANFEKLFEAESRRIHFHAPNSYGLIKRNTELEGKPLVEALFDKKGVFLMHFMPKNIQWKRGDKVYLKNYKSDSSAIFSISRQKILKEFSQGNIFRQDDLGNHTFYTKRGDNTAKMGLLNSNLDTIYHGLYRSIARIPNGNFYLIRIQNGAYAIGDNTGELLTDFVLPRPTWYTQRSKRVLVSSLKIVELIPDTLPFIIFQFPENQSALFHCEKGFIYRRGSHKFLLVSDSTFFVKNTNSYPAYFQLKNLNLKSLGDTSYHRAQPHYDMTSLVQITKSGFQHVDKNGDIIKQLESEHWPNQNLGEKFTILFKNQRFAIGRFKDFEVITPFHYVELKNSIPKEYPERYLDCYIGYGILEDGTKVLIDSDGQNVIID